MPHTNSPFGLLGGALEGTLPNPRLAAGALAGAALTFEAENKDAGAVVEGDVVAGHSSGTGVIKADATDNTKHAVGIVKTGAAATFTAVVITKGFLTKADWSAVTTEGNPTLAARAVYYLSTTAGKITATPPATAGNVVQVVGVAVSPTTLEVNAERAIRL